jgi:ATP-dependent Clp protease ATP-binding subunit ClpC
VELAERYVTDRCLPDSAFDIIDMAGASKNLSMKEPPEILDIREEIKNLEEERFNALNHGNFEIVDELNSRENELSARIAEYKRKVRNEKSVLTVTEEDIASVVSEMTNIPISKLSSSERQKIAHIDEILKEHVVGQDEAIDAICKTLKRNKVGLGDANKPMCVYMLLGPSGVGKTLIAKKLAEEIFGDEKSLVRIDMSEYSEKNSVAKLTGAAPGYIGFDNGGQLTEAIKHKQHCVLLLDEIEKADQEVYNVFLQLFDEGRLTDSAGQVVNFKNVIILMTSNVGARKAAEMGAGIGFSRNEDENKRSVVEKELKKRFSPEFLNRIDKIVYFNSLTDDNLKNIVKLEINKFNKRLNNIEYNIVYDNEVVSYVYEKARKEKEFGARPIIRIVQNDIEDKVTELMLTNDYPEHYEFSATCVNNEIRVS